MGPSARWCPMLVALLLTAAGPAGAQSLRSRFVELFIFGRCGQPLCLDGPIDEGTGHGNHYIPAAADTGSVLTTGILNDLGNSIAISVSNIPLSIGSGGATFSFEAGVPVTTAVSPGPIVGERGFTLGRHRTLVGINLTGGRFNRLRGVSLSDLRLNFIHADIGNPGLGDPQFENDVITVAPDFHFTLLVASFFASYGVTDALDIGVAVPLVHASLRGRSIGTISCDNPCVHYFEGTAANPQLVDTARVDAAATGLGDVALRLKLRLLQSGGGALALLGEARLPTGKEDDFLGSGEVDARALVIVSQSWDGFTGHGNLGYAAQGGAGRNDALLATVGFDQLIRQWFTFAADLVGRWQVGGGGRLPGPVQFFFPVARQVEISNMPDSRDNRVDASLGFKLTNGRGLTGVANASFPLKSAGLQAPLIWTVGGQYDF